MEPLSRLATIAIVAAVIVRTALMLTIEGLWGAFVIGLVIWAAAGGAMIALLAGGAWMLCREAQPASSVSATPIWSTFARGLSAAWRHLRTSNLAGGRRRVLSWTNTPRSPT